MASSKIPRAVNLPSTNVALRIAVAFSGGLDSTVLLHSTVAAYGPENVIALHVNHGLQNQADDWVLHCANIAREFEVDFDFRLLHWPDGVADLSNMEAQARTARYDALAQMCTHHGVQDLLLGHHLDDQAETVLVQLLRGCGLAGLSAMASQRLLEKTLIRVWRPFMDISRRELEAYASEYYLQWIEDPSNRDEHFTRNFIRLSVLPMLTKAQPQIVKNLSRTAQHMAQAQHLLEQLADIDLNIMTSAAGLDMAALIALRCEDTARANNALRRWISLQDLSMPSEERLTAWWHDIDHLKDLSDHQLQWTHDQKYLRLWRQKLSVHDTAVVLGRWSFRIVLQDSQEWGLAQATYDQALAQKLLHQVDRRGSEKMRVHPLQARKTLKKLFQELDVPPWQRGAQILCLAKAVLAVAGVGVNVDLLTQVGPRLVPEYSDDTMH